MKKILKSLLAITAAFLMVFSLGTAVNANYDDTKNATITVTDTSGVAGSTFKAYQILELSNSDTNYTYYVPDTYRPLLKSVLSEADSKYSNVDSISDQDIIDYIDKLDDDPTTNDTKTREFAEAVYQKILNRNITPTDSDESKIDIDNDEAKVSFTVPQGYYLIAEEDAAGSNTDSLVLLTTNGEKGITISTKEKAPTVEKKVLEHNDSTQKEGENSEYQDAADWDINDKVPFQLEGTVSNKIDNYSTYSYKFADKLSSGLTYDEGSLHVYIKNGESEYEVKNVTGTGTDKTAGYVIKTSDDSDDKYTINNGYEPNLVVEFQDLKLVQDTNNNRITVNADSVVYVRYTATLNKDAVIGNNGNPNDVVLKFENNPYYNEKGTHTPGETPKDEVVVFTYSTEFNKTQADGTTPLAGADFKLEKLVKDENGDDTWFEVGSPNNPGIKEAVGSDTTKFVFKGLDAGTYRLTETTTPDGYKTMSPVQFEIKATRADNEDKDHSINDNTMLTGLSGVITTDGMVNLGTFTNTDTKINGTLKANVKNESGSELPGTGGIGTTMFYVVGGGLVAIAAALLISKKRASAE